MSREESVRHLELAREKLTVARSLMEAGFHRDAASRAYYAMYHAAYAIVRTKGHNPRTHRGLAHVLSGFVGPHGLGPEPFAAFRRGQELREMGDYDPVLPVTAALAEGVVDDAVAFVAAAETLVD